MHLWFTWNERKQITVEIGVFLIPSLQKKPAIRNNQSFANNFSILKVAPSYWYGHIRDEDINPISILLPKPGTKTPSPAFAATDH